MKKRISKAINIFLAACMFFSPFTAFAQTESEVKATASKGDIYNPQTNTIGNSATINKNTYGSGTFTNGEVEVRKIVEKTNTEGKYKVSFEIRGKDVTQGTISVNPVYVVIVLDASNSMDNPSINKWNQAVQGAKDFAKEVLKKDNNAQIALVKFAGKTNNTGWADAIPLRGFSNTNLDSVNFGGLGVNGGATNLGEGLRHAYYMFDDAKKAGNLPSNAVKYVVVLSDGVPTLYTNESGKSVTTSESEYAKFYDTASHNYANTWADKIKSSSDLNATLISVGYELDTLSRSKDRQKAPEVLRGIATNNNFFVNTSMSDIVSKFKGLTSMINTTYYAGTNVKITDKLGADFTLESGKTTLTLDKITNKWQSLGSFYINIDKTVDTGWYPTNDGFVVKYDSYNGKEKEIKCSDNPEVFWTNEYPYTVNYYKDSITNSSDTKHFINGYTNYVENKTVISKSDINLLQYLPEGYYYDGMYNADGTNQIDGLKVDKNKTNLINILYKIKKFDYKVNYYYADMNGNYNDPDTSKTIKDVDYGTNVLTSSHYLTPDKIKQGFSLDSVTTKNTTYTINKDGIVIDIYYKRNQYDYKVNYYYADVNGNYSDPETTELVEDVNYGLQVPTSSHYLKENEIKTGFSLDEDNTENITYTIDKDGIVIDIYYKRNQYDYIVNYYYADLNNNYNTPEVTKEVTDVNYETKVPTSSHYLKSNEIKTGFSLDNITTKNITYTINKDGIVIDIYYKRNSYGYQVNYHFNNIHDSNLNYNANALYGNTIYAIDKYLELINPDGLTTKNTVDNTNYFIEPYNVNNESSIVIGDNYFLNILNIYYVNTTIEDEIIDKSTNTTVIDQSNTKVTYNINYQSTVNNVKKDDLVTVTIIDTLPAKIDTTNESTDLNDGIYNEEDNTITWTFTEEVEDFTKVYPVNKSIEYTVVYQDFANISSMEDNTLVNKVEGKTTVGDVSSNGVEDSTAIEVEIEGKVIVHYITKDGEYLTDSIEITGLVGSDYETIKKEFDKYHFIELKGEATGKIIDGVTEIFYIYDLTPLPPKTGVEVGNSVSYIEYILAILGLVSLSFVLRIVKEN